MQARYIVALFLDDYEHLKESVHDGFPDYASAAAFARSKVRCEDQGRMVNYSAVIYKISACVTVFQRQATKSLIFDQET